MDYRKLWNETKKKASEEIGLEVERASSILAEHNSIGPPSLEEMVQTFEKRDLGDCVICLESIGRKNILLSCCGKYVCVHCREQQPTKACPLCGTPRDPASIFLSVEKHAKQGQAWAQFYLGNLYCHGDADLMNKIDVDLGIYWLDVAAYQGHKAAGIFLLNKFIEMGRWYNVRVTLEMLMPFDDTTYLRDLGYIYCFREKQNLEEGVRLLTIAAKRGDIIGQFCLGNCFRLGIGVQESLEVSLHWLIQAARQNCLEAQEQVVLILFEKAVRFCATTRGSCTIQIMTLPGCCVIPSMIRWHQLVVKNGGKSSTYVVDLEEQLKSICGFCGQSEDALMKEIELAENGEVGGKVLKRCAQCKVIHYCSRECQTRHWKEGHKRDCKMAAAAVLNEPK